MSFVAAVDIVVPTAMSRLENSGRLRGTQLTVEQRADKSGRVVLAVETQRYFSSQQVQLFDVLDPCWVRVDDTHAQLALEQSCRANATTDDDSLMYEIGAAVVAGASMAALFAALSLH